MATFLSSARTRVAAISAALVLAACGDDKAQPPVVGPRASLADSADQVMFKVRYNLADAGVRRGELLADTTYSFDDNSRYEFRVVKVDFNTPQGVKNGTLTAKRGTYNTRFGLLEAFGDVRVVTQDGRKLSSPQLRYNQQSNEITTDSAFVFEDGKGAVQRGIGMKTDPNLTRVQIMRGASGEVRNVPVPEQRKP
jgi:LPS export ABC transporter protein LptC